MYAKILIEVYTLYMPIKVKSGVISLIIVVYNN